MDIQVDKRGLEIIGSIKQFEFMCDCELKPHYTVRSRLNRKKSNLTCRYCGVNYTFIYPQGDKHGNT